LINLIGLIKQFSRAQGGQAFDQFDRLDQAFSPEPRGGQAFDQFDFLDKAVSPEPHGNTCFERLDRADFSRSPPPKTRASINLIRLVKMMSAPGPVRGKQAFWLIKAK